MKFLSCYEKKSEMYAQLNISGIYLPKYNERVLDSVEMQKSNTQNSIFTAFSHADYGQFSDHCFAGIFSLVATSKINNREILITWSMHAFIHLCTMHTFT